MIESKAISKICHIIGGNPSPKENEFDSEGLPFIKMKDLGRYHLTNNLVQIENKIPHDHPRIDKFKILPVGSILLPRSGSVALNHRAILGVEASIVSHICALVIKHTTEVFSSYLYYYLTSIDMVKITKKTTGLDAITFEDLGKIKIPLPPLETQKKIAAILDKADELVQNDKKILEKYDQLAQSVFLEMFGDPVTNLKGWEKLKFSDIGKLDRGKSKHRPRNAPELLGGNYPLIQTGDVANSNGYITEFHSTYSEIGLIQSRMWLAGTLCITIAANIAKTGILTFDSCFPDSVVGFVPNEKTCNVYVQFWMSFLQKILEDTAPESAQKNINLAILRNLDIPIPPINQQRKFEVTIQQIEQQKQLTRQSLKKSEQLFQSLLQRAFKGELV